ncbi:protein PTHB1 [Toxorhynchites rutilus septentrionalis]|uniref:protein PTHB1 n=1 Tax=Toxorhynchites rutilus septentrionalis TaxID=329112 RepID=UPI00247841F2|nr:protein PTHB1 [Toxorhynchites rutilus septentrionalis]
MSLFKICNWWKVRSPDAEPNYDSFSLHCVRLCIEEGEKDSIIVGSHSGHLSIYQPSYRNVAEGDSEDEHLESVFHHSDVILEVKMPLPVIGITSGKFTTSTKADTKLNIAILHPLKVCVYQILTIDGIADHGDHSRLQLIYEHNLSKSAFSFCRGSFGGVKGRDFLCVQHMDCSLKFFEHDGISFEYQLPGERNIPSSILYIPRIDCFVTCSPSWDLECYRYQDLSETNESLRKNEPIWSMCIGEYALDLSVHQISNTESAIVVLGENNFLCLTDTGKFKFMKKLDYSPICFHCFVLGWYWEPGARLMIAIVSENGSLLLHENNQVVWSVELSEIPVALDRANVSGLPGALVTLGSTGVIDVGYLGSEPYLFKVPPMNLVPVEIDKCQNEIMEMEKEIRSGADFSDIAVINATAERDVVLDSSLDNKLLECTYPSNIVNTDSSIKMCLLTVTARVQINVEFLQICITTDPAIECSNETFLFRDIHAESTQEMTAWIYPGAAAVPASLDVKISCSYTNKKGITRVLQKLARLPLKLFVKTSQPSKETNHKITLTCHDSTDTIQQLFPEFITDGSPHALGLLSLSTGAKVTIIAAKNSNRYRVQSNDLCAIPLIIDSLIERITSRNNKSDAVRASISVSFNPPIIERILVEIEQHYQLRQQFKQISDELEVRTCQMRLFERRFATKLQERSLRALDGILMLLEENHLNVSKTWSEVKTVQSEIRVSQIRVSGLLNLFRASFSDLGIPARSFETIKGVFASSVLDNTEQSWEEMIQPTITHLISNDHFRSETKISTFDEKYIFAMDEKFSFDQFKKQLTSLFSRIEEKRSKSGRSSADYEDLEELPDENEESEGTEWAADEKFTKLLNN